MMGIFSDISEFSANQRKKRNDDLDKLFPIFLKWREIENTLSPEEKKTKKVFFLNTFIFGSVLFLVSTVVPHLQYKYANFWPSGNFEENYSTDYLMADVGFFGKSSIPSIGDISREEMSEVVSYKVQPGDSLSVIASRFGIRVKTILDNNTIENQNQLKTGMELNILPVDGILYKVKRGDTALEIAKTYQSNAEKIIKQNGVEEGGGLIAGSVIVLPGGKKPHPVAYVPPKVVPQPATSSKPVSNPAVKPSPLYVAPPAYTPPKVATGKNVWPVKGRGQITQYYRRGHYAVDIWGPNYPDILAMKAGTVIRASGGCKSRQRGCNSGYGNVLEIDHGGGLVTLYAHNTRFYVHKGQKVQAGQPIAKMGNTGTVYGRTGVHTHFEVRTHGKRVNPLLYIK